MNMCSLYNNNYRQLDWGAVYMPLFSENIDIFIGRTVKINISHKIYGRQNAIIRSFRPFYLDDRIGFMINNKEFYMRNDEIENIKIDKRTININGTTQDVIVSVIK